MNQQTKQPKIDFKELFNESSSQIHTNISQNIVLTTEDKLEICLRKHQDTLKAKSDWKTPLGIFITLVTVLITAEFKTVFGLNSDIWKASCFIACALTAGWSLKTLIKAFTLKGEGTIEKIINEIKKTSK